MNELNAIHYAITALSVVVTSVSVGLSQGMVSSAACQAMNIQPHAKDDINRAAILGSALIETTSIMGVFMAVILFLDRSAPSTWYAQLAELGIGSAICLAGAAVGIVSAWPAQQACLSTARQPFIAGWIFRYMLIVLSIMQTPLILAFIVAMLIKLQTPFVSSLADGLRLIAAGLAIGFGTIGPIIGMGLFTKKTCEGIGRNRKAADTLLPFTFINQAFMETPVIFSLLVSLLLLFQKPAADSLISGIAMLSAGLVIGLGSFGPGLNAGRIARAAAEQIIQTPTVYSSVSQANIFAQTFLDTNAIYALITAILLITLI